jgi:uncharacterized Zn-finger protein
LVNYFYRKKRIDQSFEIIFSNYTTTKKYLLQRHLKSHSTERPHKCIYFKLKKNPFSNCFLGAYCDRSFKTTIQLTNHVNTHLGIKPFQVNISLEKNQILLK